MRRVTLRSLWEHKRRLVSTVVAIVLGVAFMSGTSVFADTLDQVFDDLFSQANEEVDAQVQGESLFSSQFGGDSRRRLEATVLDEVAAVDGVEVAAPYVLSLGFGANNRVLDARGDTVGASQGPPTLIESWIEDPRLNPYELVQGDGPAADDEIALNVGAADDGELAVGDTVTVVSQQGRREYTLVGTFSFGSADSAAGAVSADFTLAEAQLLAGAEGKVDNVLAAAADDLSQDELVERIAPVLPDGAEVLTGRAAAAQQADSVQEGFEFFRVILTIFGAIALLVGTFIISNTFSILVAERTRQLALLRAVGASRGQVLGSVLLEAVVIGLVAAVLGLAGGVLLAIGVNAALQGLGVDLPSGGLVISPNTVLTALVVGLVVTVVSAVVPAVRATRVPPIAALRDVAIDRSGASRWRAGAGVVVLAVAAVLLSRAWTAGGDTDALPAVGLGALAAVVGAVVIGPVLAGPSVRLLGAALPRLKGVTGRLATENAARSPKRTAATASALLIGVALIGFITVFAASARTSVRAEVERGLEADLIVQAEAGFAGPSGFPTTVAGTVAGIDGVQTVSAIGFGEAEITYPDGGTARTFLGAVDPATVTEALTPRMEQGNVADLTGTGVLVDTQIAEKNDLAIGDPITIVVPGGESLEVTVQGISDDRTILGIWTITTDAYASVVAERLDAQVFATLVDGAELATVQADVEQALAGFPAIEVLDRDGFVGDLANQITGVLNVIYGLLALSVIIALIGIANTLSLSVHERTRELGLLRAVGMTRSQLRSAVRWEAVLISVLGTVVGLALGLLLSWALVKGLEGFGLSTFSAPLGSLAVVVVLATALGVLAARRPAKRAARLDVLEAIAAD